MSFGFRILVASLETAKLIVRRAKILSIDVPCRRVMSGTAKQRMNVVRLEMDGGVVVGGFERKGEESSSFVEGKDEEGLSGVSREMSDERGVGESDRPK